MFLKFERKTFNEIHKVNDSMTNLKKSQCNKVNFNVGAYMFFLCKIFYKKIIIYFSYAKKHLSKFLIATIYFIRNHGDNT